MKLYDVLATSFTAHATLENGTILVSCSDYPERDASALWQWDIQRQDGRKHQCAIMSGRTLYKQLKQQGVEVTLLDWQATPDHISLENCQCQDCLRIAEVCNETYTEHRAYGHRTQTR